MPRDGSGVYSKPAGTTASPNTTIESSDYNATIDDLVTDANAARPITAGGTGATSAATARTALGVADVAAAFTPASATVAAASVFLEGTDNGTNKITVQGQAVLAADQTLTLPDATGTISTVPRGHIFGLTLSNNVADATNDIDIAVGEAASDATAPSLITLASALTKRLDATWVVGTNQGMLASGAAIANTTYHIFLIKRPDTGVVDIAADTSVTGANIAANTNVAYTSIRRIGSVVRTGAAIKAFDQVGDEFLWKASTVEVTGSPSSTTAATVTLAGIPDGVVVDARVSGRINSGGPAVGLWLSSLSVDDQLPGVGGYTAEAVAAVAATGPVHIRTNASKQIRRRESDAGATIAIYCEGYVDRRGQN